MAFKGETVTVGTAATAVRPAGIDGNNDSAECVNLFTRGRTMPRRYVVRLDVWTVATGVWCPVCLLPSAVTVVVTTRRRPDRVFARFTDCADCGARLEQD